MPSAILIKLGASQNNLKPAQITKKNCETTWNDPEFQIWRNMEFSNTFHFSSFNPKCPNLGVLGQKVLTFLS